MDQSLSNLAAGHRRNTFASADLAVANAEAKRSAGRFANAVPKPPAVKNRGVGDRGRRVLAGCALV
jgi:hypothetical protein